MLTKTKKHEKALDNIANYILPTYRINEIDYVKYETACYLRQIARDALNETPDKKETPRKQKA